MGDMMEGQVVVALTRRFLSLCGGHGRSASAGDERPPGPPCRPRSDAIPASSNRRALEHRGRRAGTDRFGRGMLAQQHESSACGTAERPALGYR